MTERPILFSGAMVKAIIMARKTQTRRPLRIQPVVDSGVHYDAPTGGAMWASIRGDHGVHCPYGRPGDRLWVREAWLIDRYDQSTQYRASHPDPTGPKWKPSIHMPRERSRLNLLVTAVRVERLQDISAQDCYAEGCERPSPTARGSVVCARDNAVGWYRQLWDSLNEKRGLGWQTNPWVWVIDFRVAA